MPFSSVVTSYLILRHPQIVLVTHPLGGLVEGLLTLAGWVGSEQLLLALLHSVQHLMLGREQQTFINTHWDAALLGAGRRLLLSLEVLRVVLLTPVLLALLLLPAVINPGHTLTSGLFGLSLPLCRVAAGGEILLPLVDKVLDVLREARLERVDFGIKRKVVAAEGSWEHVVQLVLGLLVQRGPGFLLGKESLHTCQSLFDCHVKGRLTTTFALVSLELLWVIRRSAIESRT